MSRYVTYNIQAFRNREVLLAALATMGYTADKVEVHDTAQPLVGIGGRVREERANVIIRRANTGVGASNDIGFLLEADGAYRLILSDYDSNALHFNADRKVTSDWNAPGFAATVRKAYGEINGDRVIKTLLTKTIPDMKARGVISRAARVETVREGGTTRVLVHDERRA